MQVTVVLFFLATPMLLSVARSTSALENSPGSGSSAFVFASSETYPGPRPVSPLSIPVYHSVYYGTPIYDFRGLLNPVHPVLRPGYYPKFPSKPTLPPSPSPPETPTTTTSSTPDPLDDDDSGLEKLDVKLDPGQGEARRANQLQL